MEGGGEGEDKLLFVSSESRLSAVFGRGTQALQAPLSAARSLKSLVTPVCQLQQLFLSLQKLEVYTFRLLSISQIKTILYLFLFEPGALQLGC